MPADTTPDPRDMERAPAEQRIPQAREKPAAGSLDQSEVARRPPLPEHPRVMAADVVEDPTAAPEDAVKPSPGESDSELNRG
ncbi:hypothetical protein [Ramlibacter sp.]|uniref:hypothetical protein n=1 Tax=Ramlibacter sp. TaxID=1917967 RepID=UPI002D4419E0|nr:hypothetical protein [Ramlibacter sp.]HYD76815.1 hypothetical protein [Ramlibacter sp.]